MAERTLLYGEVMRGTVLRRWSAFEMGERFNGGDVCCCCTLEDLAGSLVQTLSFLCVVNN